MGCPPFAEVLLLLCERKENFFATTVALSFGWTHFLLSSLLPSILIASSLALACSLILRPAALRLRYPELNHNYVPTIYFHDTYYDVAISFMSTFLYCDTAYLSHL